MLGALVAPIVGVLSPIVGGSLMLMMLMMVAQKEEKEEKKEKDMLREESNKPNLKGGE